MQGLILVTFLMLMAVLTVYSGEAQPEKGGKTAVLVLESASFSAGNAIPPDYTCDGPDRSPPLKWKGVPAATKSLALICDDPDAPAGTWVHWVVYDISPSRDSLPEGLPGAVDTIPGGGKQGVNDFGNIGYNGPCPPDGTHHYIFKLYALDRMLDVEAGKKKSEIKSAMRGHILVKGELVGTYFRKK